jgi:transcriptional regulator with XRE-family HTH domain
MSASSPTSRGRRIAAKRAKLGLSQEELAHLCGCGLRTIQRIESDTNDAITQRLLEALHLQLRMPFADLVNVSRSTREA